MTVVPSSAGKAESPSDRKKGHSRSHITGVSPVPVAQESKSRGNPNLETTRTGGTPVIR